MTDVMREMIAQLMGAQREEEEGRKIPPYDHHSICRAYLLECCPREILSDTRLECYMSCRKLHEPAHKADYLRAQNKKDHLYDIEAFEAIEDAVRIIECEIDRTREKVKKDSEHLTDSQEFIKSQKIFEVNEKIAVALLKVESLGSEGKVYESVEMSKTVEELKKKKRELETDIKPIIPAQQRLRVCDVCGAQLNILDHETRLQDHYGGKMHLGMIEIREKYNQMKEKMPERKALKRSMEENKRQERRLRYGISSDRDKRREDIDRDNERDRRRDRSRSSRRSRSPRRSRSRSLRRSHHRSRSPSYRKSSSSKYSQSNRERKRDRH